MKRLLIVSTESYNGKSVLALSLGLWLREQGIPFTYMKPISYEVSYATGAPVDRDALTICNALGLEDEINDVAPVPLEGPFLREAIVSGDRGFRKRIAKSFERISAERDIALIEGRHFLGLGISAGLSDIDIASMLGADIVILTRYNGEDAIDRILSSLRLLEGGPNVLGVVFKGVEMSTQLTPLNEVFVPFLAERGAEVLGIVPFDGSLRSVRVAELADRLGATVANNVSLECTVSHFVVASSGPEAELRRFRRTPYLGVIVGGDRDDVHDAALRVSSLECLIVTGNRRPSQEILSRATEQGVPVLLVGQTTMSASAQCQELLSRVWVAPGETLDRAVRLFQANVDIERILEKAEDR
ncbi:MAG: phosphotransacetylase family protein [Candidatus Bipolaricaulota bacterium]|nr:MAG: phosphotransacetylase family protein [Candidatus Bipolaricaulota bacterium]